MIDFRNQPPGYEQGIYEMPFEKYCLIPALNSSKLKHMRKTPAHFKAAVDGPEKEWTSTQRKALNIGKAFDEFVLNGGLAAVDKIVAVDPGWSKNSNKYKDWKADQAGKIILSAKDKQTSIDMAAATYKKQRFSEIFFDGTPHRVFIWQCPTTGLWCKCELDWISAAGVIVDLKSTADAGFWFFQRNARRLGYLNQLALYLEGISVVTGVQHTDALLAAVETSPPYESHVFLPSHEQLYYTADQNKERRITLLNCLETDEWPGYRDEIISLESGQYEDYFNETDKEEYAYGF